MKHEQFCRQEIYVLLQVATLLILVSGEIEQHIVIKEHRAIKHIYYCFTELPP